MILAVVLSASLRAGSAGNLSTACCGTMTNVQIVAATPLAVTLLDNGTNEADCDWPEIVPVAQIRSFLATERGRWTISEQSAWLRRFGLDPPAISSWDSFFVSRTGALDVFDTSGKTWCGACSVRRVVTSGVYMSEETPGGRKNQRYIPFARIGRVQIENAC
ncbi:MAG TPA: hypothetical protein VMF11_03740 [Candidatus Baltobacteraceae bacterium]|nr:hypothetical protein [Candidatus Baltobacteraceae bacterium]